MYIINKISNVMLVCPNTMQKEREREEGEKKQETRRGDKEIRKKEEGKKERREGRKRSAPCVCPVKFKYVITLNHIILKDTKSKNCS